MASGQVDMAGAWYIHAIDFQAKGKSVEGIVQLSGAPGEREMCASKSGVHSGADFKGKTHRRHRPRIGHRHAHPVHRREKGGEDQSEFTPSRSARAPRPSRRCRTVSRLCHDDPADGRRAREEGSRYSAVDLATTAGATARRSAARGRPRASLARTDWVDSHKDAVAEVVDALVATMHWINTHTAADIADKLPPSLRVRTTW